MGANGGKDSRGRAWAVIWHICIAMNTLLDRRQLLGVVIEAAFRPACIGNAHALSTQQRADHDRAKTGRAISLTRYRPCPGPASQPRRLVRLEADITTGNSCGLVVAYAEMSMRCL